MGDGNALTRWVRRTGKESEVVQRHAPLAAINQTVTEYAELIEEVSHDRASLLLEISKLQLKIADLSVSKALYTDLEIELKNLRKMAEDAVKAVEENRMYKEQIQNLRSQLNSAEQVIRELRQENGNLKGQITRAKNREQK